MNDHLESSKSDVMGTISADTVQLRGLNPKFALFAAVLTLSLVGAALSIKRARVEYDSSAQCLLNNKYTEITKTENSSTTYSYRVSYRFATGGQTYSGTDEIVQEPTNATATVYFTAARPEENALYPTHWNNTALIVARDCLRNGADCVLATSEGLCYSGTSKVASWHRRFRTRAPVHRAR